MQANDASLLKCGIETGAVAAINAHMGNVAFKTGRKVYWDTAKGEFKNDAEANALMKAHYQNGWKLPKAKHLSEAIQDAGKMTLTGYFIAP